MMLFIGLLVASALRMTIPILLTAIGATFSGSMRSVPGPGGPAMRVNAAGAMRLTLMPCAAPAVVRLRVSPMTAALAAAYERLLGSPNMPVDVVMTMRP